MAKGQLRSGREPRKPKAPADEGPRRKARSQARLSAAALSRVAPTLADAQPLSSALFRTSASDPLRTLDGEQAPLTAAGCLAGKGARRPR